MLNTLDRSSIESFLNIARKEIKRKNCYLVNTEKRINGKKKNTKQMLIDLGIVKIDQVWEYVLELKTYECVKVDFDYDSSRDTNCEIFVFKKIINHKVAYIKLTMRSNSRIICLSFHEDY